MLEYIVTEENFIDVKSMGINSIRLSLNTYKDFENNSHNFGKLDNIIEFAEKKNIYLIISMRQSPGGHNPSNHSGNDGKNELLDNYEDQQRIITLWRTIADRYVNKSIIAGYDLLNEPLAPNSTILNKVYGDISQAIRDVDKNHILFLEGNNWTKSMDWVDNPTDNKTVLSFHFYDPGSYAVDGQGIYPSIIQGQVFNKDALRERLLERLKYIRNINKPIFVGEFGAVTSAENY